MITHDAQIVPASSRDWQTFQNLAQQEGWRVPQSELALHQQGGCSQAWALRDNKDTIGLVTGVLHQSSAWIGNLIIAPAARGRGYGVALFAKIVHELRAAGAMTLWLTASSQGAPLYAARGFQPVGEIERWVRKEGGRGEDPLLRSGEGATGVDTVVWGDDRYLLIHHLEGEGKWMQHGESLALLQSGADLQIIGPWYGSSCREEDDILLERLVASSAPQQELVIDLLGSSRRQGLLAAAGFAPAGTNRLMVAGPIQVQWSRLLALATLGSCG